MELDSNAVARRLFESNLTLHRSAWWVAPEQRDTKQGDVQWGAIVTALADLLPTQAERQAFIDRANGIVR